MTTGNPVLVWGTEVSCTSAIPQRIAPDGISEARFLEDLPQELIHRHPEILPIHEFLPSAKHVFSLGQEITVELRHRAAELADRDDGRMDNVLVTDDGHLVVVEDKLWRNPESTRGVVAQILEYGVTLENTPLQTLEERLRSPRKGEPVLQADETIDQAVARMAVERGLTGFDAQAFADALDRNYRRGQFLLLVVGDYIKGAVKRMGLWLRDLGSKPLVFGLVEFRMYRNPDGSMLAAPIALFKTATVSRTVVLVDVSGEGAHLARISRNESDTDREAKAKAHDATQKPQLRPISTTDLLAEIEAARGIAAKDLVAGILERLQSEGLAIREKAAAVSLGLPSATHPDRFYSLLWVDRTGSYISATPDPAEISADSTVKASLRAEAAAQLPLQREETGRLSHDALTPAVADRVVDVVKRFAVELQELLANQIP